LRALAERSDKLQTFIPGIIKSVTDRLGQSSSQIFKAALRRTPPGGCSPSLSTQDGEPVASGVVVVDDEHQFGRGRAI